jgi:hypothetical protein
MNEKYVPEKQKSRALHLHRAFHSLIIIICIHK